MIKPALNSQLNYQAVFETAQDYIAVLSLDGVFQALNPSFERITGFRPESWIGRHFKELVHPDDFPAIEKRFRELGTKPSELNECRLVRRDGTFCVVEASGSPILENGRIIGIATIVRDITERKKNEAFVETVLENIPDMIFVKEARELRFVRFNRAGEELLGYSREDLIGKNDYDFFPKAEADFFLQKDRSVLNEKNLLDIPKEPIHTKKKGMRTLHTKKIPILDVNGEPLFLLGISEDITERVNAERALVRSEKELRRIVSSISDCLWSAEIEGAQFREYRYFSPVAQALTGRDASYFMGSLDRWLGIVHMEDRSWLQERLRLIFSGASSREVMEYRIYRTDGTQLWVQEIVSATDEMEEGTAEKFRLVNGMISDITVRKEEERRTQQREELRRSNTDLEQFAFVASHDLKEPLRAIAMYCELLLEKYAESLPQEGLECIEQAVSGTQRMYLLINGLLEYSRVNHGTSQEEDFDASEVLKRVLEGLCGQIADVGAEVTFDPLCPLRGSSLQFAQVLQNLIGNALKFSGGKKPKVHVGCTYQADGTPRFFVRDNGIGIEPRYFERIFIIFQRLNSAESYTGTGLGLAICKKLVERNLGKIWVESTPGQGSTFHFTFGVKAAVGVVRPAKPMAVSITPSKTPVSTQVARTIVAIDDDKNQLIMIEYLIKELVPNVKFVGVTNGPALLAYAGEVEQGKLPLPDVLLMDINMPGASGLEMLEALRNKSFFHDRPKIVMLSSSVDSQRRETFLKLGANAAFEKPFALNDWRKMLQHILEDPTI